jgi:hypothetical protein
MKNLCQNGRSPHRGQMWAQQNTRQGELRSEALRGATSYVNSARVSVCLSVCLPAKSSSAPRACTCSLLSLVTMSAATGPRIIFMYFLAPADMLQCYLCVFHLARLPSGCYSSDLVAYMTEQKEFSEKQRM